MPQGSHLCCVGKPRRTQTKHPDDVKDCLLLFHRNPLTRVPPHVLWVVGIVSRTTSSCSQSVAQFHFPAIKTNYSCCGFLLLLTHVLLELWVVLRVSSMCLRLNVSGLHVGSCMRAFQKNATWNRWSVRKCIFQDVVRSRVKLIAA